MLLSRHVMPLHAEIQIVATVSGSLLPNRRYSPIALAAFNGKVVKLDCLIGK